MLHLCINSIILNGLINKRKSTTINNKYMEIVNICWFSLSDSRWLKIGYNNNNTPKTRPKIMNDEYIHV